ncbi:TRAP transporter large permease subunit [Tissierella sp. Yu-01]|uniref:TRAP transporter large permease subunit n=1 Tax=Tissierella sp. Yu-01 TaxID=3035694 RepID=UPI00240D212B|nr:TRAP transporter large permease subunit [Tissierella sp. Yu-01]WFA10083.1 TRAP transporter large permease subunit [Tissierella sp. Yu-01]
MEIEFGSWSIVNAPSLLALIPLIVYVVMSFKGKNNVSGLLTGIALAALMMGLNLKKMAQIFQAALGSTTVLIGLIILAGAGLGVLMTETRVTHTLVYWIVKKIGVNTQTKAKIALIICSVLICGMLGTLGGGNAVIAPIMIPIMASLGVVPTVVAVLFKTAGEVGLILGPLTGVTLITMEVTGLSYVQLMLFAALPFSVVWLIGAWIGTNRTQRRLEGKEAYKLDEDIKSIDTMVIEPKEKRTAIAFLVSFILLVGYGVVTKQGTNYALIVMILLAAVVAIFNKMNIDEAVALMGKGMASQFNMFLIFITIEVLLNLVTVGGGFDALANLLGGLVKQAGPTAVYIIASIVGGFGIEAAAVAEIKIIADMFGGLATEVGLPMTVFATSILAATRVTGSIYPTTNFAGQMGTAQCENTKEALQALWISVGIIWAWILLWGFIGPIIF